MPHPVSLTESRTWAPAREPGCAATKASSSSTGAVSRVSRPPCGMASRALTVRFISTCSICPGSAETRPVSASEPELELDVLSDEPAEHRRQVADQRVDVEHLRLEDLLAAEGQELARQAGRALGRPPDLLHVVGQRVALLQHAPDQVAVAHDDGQEVVEVVGDPAGQAADGLHLLRLPQLGLEALPLGDVLQDRQRPDRRAGGVPEEREREAALHPAPVAGQDLGLVLPDAVLHPEAPHQRPCRVPSAPLELGDRPAQHLVGAVAEELLGPRAPVRDSALHVGGHDSRGRVLRDGAEEVAGAARLLVEPGVADRPRGLADEALEELPVLGVEVERRPPVQREDAEQRVLMDDRHDVRAPEVVLPEPLHGEDAPVREDVRDDQSLAVRRDPAGQPLLELDAAARVRGGELRVRERPRVERPRRLVGHPEPDGRRAHQLGRRARDLAEDLVEVERRRDDARQPGDLLEAGEPPVGGRTLAAQPRVPGGRPLPAHGRVRRLRRPAPCIRSAGTGMRRRRRPLARSPGSNRLGRRPRGSCTPGSRSRPPSPPAPRPCRRGTSAPEERARSGTASGTPSAAGRQGRDTAVSPPVGAHRQLVVAPVPAEGSEADHNYPEIQDFRHVAAFLRVCHRGSARTGARRAWPLLSASPVWLLRF